MTGWVDTQVSFIQNSQAFHAKGFSISYKLLFFTNLLQINTFRAKKVRIVTFQTKINELLLFSHKVRYESLLFRKKGKWEMGKVQEKNKGGKQKGKKKGENKGERG